MRGSQTTAAVTNSQIYQSLSLSKVYLLPNLIMLFSTFTAGAVLVAVAAAAPKLIYLGPPVVYYAGASAPLVTATILAALTSNQRLHLIQHVFRARPVS